MWFNKTECFKCTLFSVYIRIHLKNMKSEYEDDDDDDDDEDDDDDDDDECIILEFNCL